MCRAGVTLEEAFEAGRPELEAIFHRIHDHVSQLPDGELIVDPLDAGIMFKNGPMFCMLRSMKKWVAVQFVLARKLESSRLSRKVSPFQGKFPHVVNVDDVEMIDDEFLDWITEAFYFKTPGLRPDDIGEQGGDGMVPDDLDPDEMDLDL